METTIASARNQIDYKEGGIISKVLDGLPGRDATLFCMAAGTSISEHTSTRAGRVIVLEGEGSFRLRGMDIPMKRGTEIKMPENAVHSLKAKEDTSFLLLLEKK